MKRNKKRGICQICGDDIFFMPVNVPGYGHREWWHEDMALDEAHEASPVAVVASGGVVGRLPGEGGERC